MSDYTEYFLNSRITVVQLDLIELTHPNFTQPYRIVRNAPNGVTVNLSDDEQGVEFTYYPARVQQNGARDDLDSSVHIDLGDLGEVVPGEIDAVANASGFGIKPTMRYWTFRSDVMTGPIYGPIYLEIPQISFSNEAASFDASAPQANSSKTGERITMTRFPMQKGFAN